MFYLIVFVLALCTGGFYFAKDMVHNQQAHTYRVWNQELTGALQHSITDAEAMALAAAIADGGQVTAIPPDGTTTGSVCGATDANNATEADCSNTITQLIHFTGATATTSSGSPQAVGNVNTASGPNTLTFERELTFQVTETLKSPDGATIVVIRNATGALDVINNCDDATSCHNNQIDPQITFDGWQDADGNHIVAAAGRGDGKCPTTDATCSTVGLDSGRNPAAQSDDSRAHRTTYCFDPNYVGNGGTNPGDLCNPAGDPNWTPQLSDTFSNQTLDNAAATAGNFSH